MLSISGGWYILRLGLELCFGLFGVVLLLGWLRWLGGELSIMAGTEAWVYWIKVGFIVYISGVSFSARKFRVVVLWF